MNAPAVNAPAADAPAADVPAADAQQSSGGAGKVRAVLERNRELLRNAGSLAASTGLTSLFGFAFWIIAAKEFKPQEVGYGVAATNALQLLGTIGMFGLGTMLIGELPRRRERGGLFTASVITSAAGSLVLALVFLVAVEFTPFRRSFPGVVGTPLGLLIFTAGVVLTGATLVFDEGTIGMLRGGVQLSRNLAMSGLKLAILPATTFFLHDGFGMGIAFSFVAGTGLSMLPAVVMLARHGSRIFHRPDWLLLRRLFKVALNHNWLNLAIATPPRLIPVVVTLAVGPKGGAAFYVAYMIVAFLFMVPTHLSTVLFAIASASPELIAEKLRFVLRVSIMIGLPVMAVLAVSAHFALGFFNPYYAQVGTVPLWLLIIGYLPQMPKAQFIAVSRATNKVGRAAALLCCTASCEVAAIFIGGRMGGLDGLSFAYLGVLTCEGLITAPTVLRAAYARTAAATGSFPAIPADLKASGALPKATGPLARMTGELVRLTGSLTELPGTSGRQDTGLAALLALASAAVSDGQTLDVATEVWRTGGFPVIPSNATGPRVRPSALTTLDLLGGQSVAGGPTRRLSYRHRQQAGIDALIALADPEDQQEEPSGRSS
jgi:O-antigen/teichoic acid export membrane protein